MAARPQNQLEPRPWVESTARRIADPVRRLRFLQAVAPPSTECETSRKSYKRLLPLIVLVLAVAACLQLALLARGVPHASGVAPRPQTAKARVDRVPQIWQVDKLEHSDTYSNGLRIENRHAVANRPRSYLAFSTARPEDTRGERRTNPVGIVFHTTESLQAPFEPDHNAVLKRVGESLLDYVRRKRAYNFLIDRFGRVYRIVVESDAADHAGHSVWSDEEWSYVNLNDSFLGVSFETQTLPGQMVAALNPAQVRSAVMLTEMLRSRYGIAAGNCITHAQVSVNPSNMRVGYHTDWASSFPFEQLGLPDNYARPLPAIAVFGFEYDSNFVNRTGMRMYEGVQLAEQALREHAAAAHLKLPAYLKTLQRKYLRQAAAAGRPDGEPDESE
jgi:hypothetical protein